jgi:hypothetical protein
MLWCSNALHTICLTISISYGRVLSSRGGVASPRFRRKEVKLKLMSKGNLPTEIDLWTIGHPGGGSGLWRPTLPEIKHRVYVVFATKAEAEEHAEALTEDLGEAAREWARSRVRKVNPREIPRAAMVADGVARYPDGAMAFSLCKWGVLLDEYLAQHN